MAKSKLSELERLKLELENALKQLNKPEVLPTKTAKYAPTVKYYYAISKQLKSGYWSRLVGGDNLDEMSDIFKVYKKFNKGVTDRSYQFAQCEMIGSQTAKNGSWTLIDEF